MDQTRMPAFMVDTTGLLKIWTYELHMNLPMERVPSYYLKYMVLGWLQVSIILNFANIFCRSLEGQEFKLYSGSNSYVIHFCFWKKLQQQFGVFIDTILNLEES
jgi:hypothetical protein